MIPVLSGGAELCTGVVDSRIGPARAILVVQIQLHALAVKGNVVLVPVGVKHSTIGPAVGSNGFLWHLLGKIKEETALRRNLLHSSAVRAVSSLNIGSRQSHGTNAHSKQACYNTACQFLKIHT